MCARAIKLQVTIKPFFLSFRQLSLDVFFWKLGDFYERSAVA